MEKTDNQLIAEFMEIDWNQYEKLKRNYDSNLSELFPVVRKFLTILKTTKYKNRSNEEWSNAIRGNVERSIWNYIYSEGTIQDVYNELSVALKWHNSI